MLSKEHGQVLLIGQRPSPLNGDREAEARQTGWRSCSRMPPLLKTQSHGFADFGLSLWFMMSGLVSAMGTSLPVKGSEYCLLPFRQNGVFHLKLLVEVVWADLADCLWRVWKWLCDPCHLQYYRAGDLCLIGGGELIIGHYSDPTGP